MKHVTPAFAALCAVVVAATPALAASRPPAHIDSYGTKAPYAPKQHPASYGKVPAGFVPVFTENVSRHGSRAATDSDDGDLILALWDQASASGQLTGKGEEFGPKVRALLAAMTKVGYGNLSGRGREEMRETADRMAARLPGLFSKISASGEKIDVVSSGQGRAIDSANTYAGELAAKDPALKPLIGATRTDKDLLYFHKAAGGKAYQEYLANDQRLASTLKSITDQPKTQQAATSVLRKLFKRDFVDGISDQVAAAEAVYNLYAIAPAMIQESPEGKGWGLERYISHSDAAWFGYLGDAEDFYEKGPGFSDSDITYKMANVLLDDFFNQVKAKKSGTSTLGAELRFTHAEEIIPLAALMGLPESTKPATPGQSYTYKNNPWRGADVAPLGANIQWDVYQKGTQYLVRMLYNEKEIPFKADCEPVAKNSKFYDFTELQRCFKRG
ncbi:histidine-type phosphatase [Streptomyces acidiscabies]|uniref:histidine-type phosphatase n=1 Tax=Streptomyces acidiscabies TaxID=42234 RepID=UPI00073E9F69|nr:histidine-type phosphatase [Streptomyces acidiscabies]GAQ58573.1 histidine phosphatase superfamily (branch 2 [Streptomyces acidiscabies]GAV40598.1 histidine phosphatase superfamily (branch 2 [Streptomyces acidiscabies]